MSISIINNYELNASIFLDSRRSIASLNDLKRISQAQDILYPHGFEVFCVQEGSYYVNVSPQGEVPEWKLRLINDEEPSFVSTYSSQKISELLQNISEDDTNIGINDNEPSPVRVYSSQKVESIFAELRQETTRVDDDLLDIDTRVDYLEGEMWKIYGFDGSYDSLTNKPTIPSIDGLATKEYVDDAVANSGGDVDLLPINNSIEYIKEMTDVSQFNVVNGMLSNITTFATNKANGDSSTKRYINANVNITKTAYGTNAMFVIKNNQGQYCNNFSFNVLPHSDLYNVDNQRCLWTINSVECCNGVKIQVKIYSGKQFDSNFALIDSAEGYCCIEITIASTATTEQITMLDTATFIIDIIDYNYLTLDGKLEYTPTKDYHPATKKYVDDNKFSKDYNDLENKPCYIITEEEVILNTTTFTFVDNEIDEYFYSQETLDSLILELDSTYRVTYNGTDYECVTQLYVYDDDVYYLGNLSILWVRGANTGEPFLFEVHASDNYQTNVMAKVSQDMVVEITKINKDIKKLDEELLPDTVATKEYVDSYVNEALDGIGSGGDTGSGNVGSDVDLTDLVVTNSISIGRKENTTIGTKSFAVGYDVTASGENSHAEGNRTEASGLNSHAEGAYTTASGVSSHAEGSDTTASSWYSHAEGFYTTASGVSSHAEGYYAEASNRGSHAEGYYTKASGMDSHAEGNYTIASNNCSHAEGIRTIASSENQHVQGKYNIEDTANTYAHIVGNGSSSARSNAHTLDWDGNAWYAGQVMATNLPWSTLEIGELIIEQTVLFDTQSNGIGIGFTDDIPITFAEGEKICFTFDNEQYICETRRLDEDNIYIGNGTLDSYDEIHNNEPFGVDFSRYGDMYIVRIYTTEKYAGLEVPVKIEKVTGELHKLDEKYLPDIVYDKFTTKEYVDDAIDSVDVTEQLQDYAKKGDIPTKTSQLTNDSNFLTSIPSEYITDSELNAKGYVTESHVDSVKNSALLKTEQELTDEEIEQVKANIRGAGKSVEGIEQTPYTIEETDTEILYHYGTPIIAGEYSEIFNFPGNIATGSHSSAKGYKTQATGQYSKASGWMCIASGLCSDASGLLSVASGPYSHCEGTRSQATKNNAHAEGDGCTASGNNAHAEGYHTQATTNQAHSEGGFTVASGVYSHAEGEYAKASGRGAHAEGFHTLASGRNAFSAGEYVTSSGRGQFCIGKYNTPNTTDLFIIGNGTADTTEGRSNALTVDTSGNAKFSGNVSINGTPTNNNHLVTKKYVDDAVSNISTGGDIDTNDLVVTNSISMGRKADTTIGERSFAVGMDVEASGLYSHAEGYYTKASEYDSHAEGYKTTASAYDSHAEGNSTIASGEGSHAEGHETEASGLYSHSEGDTTTASGASSHSEGYHTKANGHYSHAEGYYTIASSRYQHVQGQYNIEDSANTYAHIVGNGDESARSNAHTLDWDGNAWYKGNVTVGEDNKKLATESYVDDAVANLSELKINIVNGLTFTNAYINYNNGDYVSGGSAYACQEYIPVISGATYEVSGVSNIVRIAYYDSSKAYINQYIDNTPTFNFTPPSNASYIRFHVDSTSNTWQNLSIESEIEDYVRAYINNSTSGGSGSESENVDLSSYALKTDLHSHSNKTVIDTITSNMITNWNQSIPFNDTYVSDCNAWLTNGYVKTGANQTSNLPSACTGSDRWGILFFIAENATQGTGTQMYFPIDGTYKGRIFTRSLTNMNQSPIVGEWNLLSTFSGNYNDLTNKPTIPTVTNDLTNELKSNYDTAYNHSQSTHAPSNAQKNSDITKAEIETKLIGNITSHTHEQYLTEHQNISHLANKSDIPTKVSQLENDEGYLTEHQSLEGLATEGYVTNMLGGLQLIRLTQSEYDALGVKDSNTLYIII